MKYNKREDFWEKVRVELFPTRGYLHFEIRSQLVTKASEEMVLRQLLVQVDIEDPAARLSSEVGQT